MTTTFAGRLKECIKGKASQAELARRAGVSDATVSDWMRSITSPENMKAEPLLRAAAFLEVNPMWLLTGKGSREANSPTVLTAEEPRPRYSNWPFERVAPEKYYSLPEHVRTGIQLMVDGAVLGATSPAKSTGTEG